MEPVICRFVISIVLTIFFSVFTVNPVTGTPKNPYKPKCSCGGSSGGSGGSVAAGLVPISIGADSGGSIRYEIKRKKMRLAFG